MFKQKYRLITVTVVITVIRVCLLNPNQAHNFICGLSG